MIFLANRANLDRRTLLTRLHDRFQTQASTTASPVEQVRYQTSPGNKVGVRVTIDAPAFVGSSYATAEAELHVSLDFPPDRAYDYYRIQWVEPERAFMLGWYQDETHMNLGDCHLQLDYRGETVQRASADFLDSHPLNVFEQRMAHLVDILDAVDWNQDRPEVPAQAIR